MEAKGDGVKSLVKIPSSKAHKNAKMAKVAMRNLAVYLFSAGVGDPGVTRMCRKWGCIDVDVSEHEHPLRTESDK